MVMRVQVVDGEYRVVLPPEAVKSLNLTDGAEVELRSVAAQSKYVGVDEAMASYLRTKPLHHKTYTELAK